MNTLTNGKKGKKAEYGHNKYLFFRNYYALEKSRSNVPWNVKLTNERNEGNINWRQTYSFQRRKRIYE